MIDVIDNGPGMDKEIVDQLYENGSSQLPHQNEGHGIGMLNVQRRLTGIFGKEAGLQIISGGSGTIVRMIIPNQKERTDEDCGSR